VTEIGLTVAISLAALVFAALLTRWTASFEPSSAEARRLNGAVRRAADALLWGADRATMAIVGVVVVVLFAAHSYSSNVGGPTAGLQMAFHTTLFLATGALGACITAHVATHLARIGSFGTVTAARLNLDTATGTATRAAAAAAFAAVGTSMLSAAVVAILVFTLLGGFAGDTGALVRSTTNVAVLLPAHALGAGVAALVVQRAGAVYRASTRVGAALAGEGQSGLRHDDARNPAMVARLVGNHVGVAAARAVDFHVAISTATAVAGLLGSATYGASGSAALALFPFAVLAFGILASGFGVMVVRHSETESPTWALWRGHATTSVVTLGGLAGASIWLLEDHWELFFLAGAVGFLALVAVTHLGRVRLGRRLGLLRELHDAARLGPAPAITSGLGVGLQTAMTPVVVVGLVLALAWQLGEGSQVPLGGLMGVWTAIMSLLAAGPYLLTVATFGTVTNDSLGVLAMNSATATPSIARHTEQLDEAGFAASLVAHPYLIITSSLIALSVSVVIPAASGATDLGIGAASVNLAKPLVVWGGMMGALSVLAYSGQSIRLVTRAVRDIAAEVDRQLRRFPREHGVLAIPEDFAPSYRACIDLANRRALSGLLLPVGAVVTIPVGIAVVPALLRASEPGISAETLTSFLAVATITGLGSALVVDAAGSLLTAGRRVARQRGRDDDALDSTAAGDAFANILRSGVAAPAALLIKVMAIVTLIVVPFLT
jgi:Na+/H+-translocating membrane pyrophosphatase